MKPLDETFERADNIVLNYCRQSSNVNILFSVSWKVLRAMFVASITDAHFSRESCVLIAVRFNVLEHSRFKFSKKHFYEFYCDHGVPQALQFYTES